MFSGQVAHQPLDLRDHRMPLMLVSFDNGVHDPRFDTELVRHGGQSASVLREAGAAVAGTGMEKLAADAVVHSHAPGNVVNVAPDRVAEISDFVDEGYLGGEKRVGGVLDQLRRLERCDDY